MHLPQCLRREFSCKIDARQEARIIELIQRLLKSLSAVPMDHNDQPTPRHCFAKFLEQVLISRTASRQKSSSELACSARSTPKMEEQSQNQHATFTAMSEPLPELHDKPANQFVLHPSDPAFLQAWSFIDNQPMPSSMETLFGFSNSQPTPDFMNFQDQSWFM